jgi:hypothetical protein
MLAGAPSSAASCKPPLAIAASLTVMVFAGGHVPGVHYSRP